MNYKSIYPSYLGLLFLLFGLISCSGSKNLSTNDSAQNLMEIKEYLKFKTHFGAEGSMNIKATNSGNKALEISELSVIIEQVDSKQSKSYSLEELGVTPKIAPSEMAVFELSLEDRITQDFDGVKGKYNVVLAYGTDKALKNTDERSIYFITYKYPNK